MLKRFAGEQLKTNLQSVFSDARLTDSLLVIENVQDLPVSADEPTILVACLASFLRSFPGVCVLCGACATDSTHRLHPLLKRLLRFTLHLQAMGQKQVCEMKLFLVWFLRRLHSESIAVTELHNPELLSRLNDTIQS